MLKDKVFEVYKVKDTDPESAADGCTPLSTILQGMPDEGQLRPDIPLMPEPFLFEPYVHEKWAPSLQPEAADTKAVHIYHAFSLPNLLDITETEMQVLRRQSADAATQFRIVMDEWSEICTETDDAKERLAFFRKRIIPECKKLELAFNGNDIIKQCYREQKKDMKYKIWIGEVPVPLLFQFQGDCGIMGDKTKQVLEKWMRDDEQTEARWPFMAMDCPGIVNEEVGAKEEEVPVLQTKKSLRVD